MSELADRAAGEPSRTLRRATCATCPHACTLRNGQLGICGARVGRDDDVADQNYGRVTSLALDPIEKKPIARWMPGTLVLSEGSYGCNLRCPFCQNASIACAREDDVPWRYVRPEELVSYAALLRDEHVLGPRWNTEDAAGLAHLDYEVELESARARNHAAGDAPVIGLAYTYNEPLVGWEYVRDCSNLAHEEGLFNVLVSNGMANRPVIEQLLPVIDAANIDLKGFTQEFYDVVGGDLETVKQTIELFAQQSTCHLEVTMLVVPGLNDDLRQVEDAARWLAGLNPDIPFHLNRFFPCHRMADAQPTDVDLLRRLQDVASRHLETVLVGNV